MTETQINTLRELAADNGVDFNDLDTIDTDCCGCPDCYEMAELAVLEAAL